MNLMEKYQKRLETARADGEITTARSILVPVQAVKDGIEKAPPMGNDLPAEVKKAYEERSAIMEHENDLDQDEAERQAWCREACMLSFPSQWRICERVKPKPCPKLQINFHVR